eukprot:PhM_4_TR5345/c2_g1_i1/m.32602/K13510/LPCAT1_2; lysophosphatidylcholine acyltransferase / lyso-PAF acetyltransferase
MRSFGEIFIAGGLLLLFLATCGYLSPTSDPFENMRGILQNPGMHTHTVLKAYSDNLQTRVDSALQDLFLELDKNGDGVITIDEFKGMTLGAWAAFRSFNSWPETLESVAEFRSNVETTWATWSWFTRYIVIMVLFQGFLFTVEQLWCILGLPRSGFKYPTLDLTAKPLRVEKSVALTYDTPLQGWYEITKMIFFTCTGLMLVRFIQAALCFSCGVVAINIAVIIPNNLWFAFWSRVTRLWGYGVLFSLGFYRINVKGSPASRSEAKIFVGNHICLVEVIVLFIESGMPSFVSRLENLGIPLFSGLIRATDSILVDRADPKSRENTLEEMCRRGRDPTAPQLMVFPEGTCDNQRALFQFKRGPFEPQCPVQPVCFKLPYTHFNPAWTGQMTGGNDLMELVYRMLCQFVNRCEVRFLPPYIPSEAEKKDSILYASNVRDVMACQLGIPVSEATFEDYKEAGKAYAALMQQAQTRTKGGWMSKKADGFWLPVASFGWMMGRAHTFVEAVRSMTPRRSARAATQSADKNEPKKEK